MIALLWEPPRCPVATFTDCLKLTTWLLIAITNYCQSRKALTFLLPPPFLCCDYTSFKVDQRTQCLHRSLFICSQSPHPNPGRLEDSHSLVYISSHWPVGARPERSSRTDFQAQGSRVRIRCSQQILTTQQKERVSYRRWCSKHTHIGNIFRKRNGFLNEWETLANKNEVRMAMRKEYENLKVIPTIDFLKKTTIAEGQPNVWCFFSGGFILR